MLTGYTGKILLVNKDATSRRVGEDIGIATTKHGTAGCAPTSDPGPWIEMAHGARMGSNPPHKDKRTMAPARIVTCLEEGGGQSMQAQGKVHTEGDKQRIGEG